jgi:CRP-like cAMP-binding protein
VLQDSFTANRELIQALEQKSLPIDCREARTLFVQGESCNGLYILLSGEPALLMRSPSGRTVMCLSVGSGSLLGLPALVGREKYTLTAMVRSGSKIRYMSREEFENLIQAEPSLYPSLLTVLASEVRLARRALSKA